MNKSKLIEELFNEIITLSETIHGGPVNTDNDPEGGPASIYGNDIDTLKHNVSEKEGDSARIKKKKAKEFLLSLPKYTPTEAWGDPKQVERKEINKIFKGLARGGASVQDRLKNFNRIIYNPTGGIGSKGGVREILSGLVALESLTAVIRSFNESSAGFVFEGFLAALFQGEQEAGRDPEKGNLPIEDLIAFSTIKGKAQPLSLKLLSQGTLVEGSYTNLVDALFGKWSDGMLYLVARKDGKEMSLELFSLTQDNFVDAIAFTDDSNTKLSAAALKLFTPNNQKVGERNASMMIRKINAAKGDAKYELLKNTQGYRKSSPKKQKSGEEDSVNVAGISWGNPDRAFNNPTIWGAPRPDKFEIYFKKVLKIDPALMRLWNINDKSTETSVLKVIRDLHNYHKPSRSNSKAKIKSISSWPEWENILAQPRSKLSSPFEKKYLLPLRDTEMNSLKDLFDNMLRIRKGESIDESLDTTPFTVSENKAMWEHEKEHGLLTESKGGTQWSISPARLPQITNLVEYEALGTLPYSDDAVLKMATMYIDKLEAVLGNVFEQVKSLSDNVNKYFFSEDLNRSGAMSAAGDATRNATEVAKRMKKESK